MFMIKDINNKHQKPIYPTFPFHCQFMNLKFTNHLFPKTSIAAKVQILVQLFELQVFCVTDL